MADLAPFIPAYIPTHSSFVFTMSKTSALGALNAVEDPKAFMLHRSYITFEDGFGILIVFIVEEISVCGHDGYPFDRISSNIF